MTFLQLRIIKHERATLYSHRYLIFGGQLFFQFMTYRRGVTVEQGQLDTLCIMFLFQGFIYTGTGSREDRSLTEVEMQSLYYPKNQSCLRTCYGHNELAQQGQPLSSVKLLETLKRNKMELQALPFPDQKRTTRSVPRGDGVMDCVVACCAGGPGSIPTIDEVKQGAIQMVFLSA